MIMTLEWTDAGVRFIDQTKLPTEETYIVAKDYQQVADIISTMVVRGAPAIGVAAAMGVAIGVLQSEAKDVAGLRADLDKISKVIGGTRPTAVNLFWAIRRMGEKFDSVAHLSEPQIQAAMVEEAKRMHVEDVASNQAMGRHGAVLLPASGNVLTDCNAGASATAAYAASPGVILAARESGKNLHAFADVTPAVRQGRTLTAGEL